MSLPVAPRDALFSWLIDDLCQADALLVVNEMFAVNEVWVCLVGSTKGRRYLFVCLFVD